MAETSLHFDGSAAALQRDHLFNHLTDGRWHDDCAHCRQRRIHGGTGLDRTSRPGSLPEEGSNG